MSKIRKLVEARRVELLNELAECDEFLGIPSHGTAADLDAKPRGVVVQARSMPTPSEPFIPPSAVIEAPAPISEAQLAQIIAIARGQTAPPMARPRGASEAVLDAALQGVSHYTPNGIPVINPNDRMVTDPATGSVTRIPNGANQ